MKKTIILLSVVLIMIAMNLNAAGQKTSSYPQRAVQLVVPAAPGGGTDTAARILAKHLEKVLGSPVVVSNMAGAGGSLASRHVKDSKPDGYTMLFYNEAIITNKQAGVTEYGIEAFDIVGIPITVDTSVLVTRNTFQTFEDFINAANKNPGKLRAGAQSGTFNVALYALIEKSHNIRIQQVDLGSVNDNIAGLLGGHIDIMQAPYGIVKDYINAGEFAAVANLGNRRSSFIPEVPTLGELGVPFVLPKFYFVAYPLNTPNEIKEIMKGALLTVVSDQAFIKDANNAYYTVTPDLVDEKVALQFIHESEKSFEIITSIIKEYESKM